MRYHLQKLPTWLLAIGIALAIALHVAQSLPLGTLGTMVDALGVIALVIVA